MYIIKEIFYNDKLKDKYRSEKYLQRQKELSDVYSQKLDELRTLLGEENQQLLMELDDAIWNICDEERYCEFEIGWKIGAKFAKKTGRF